REGLAGIGQEGPGDLKPFLPGDTDSRVQPGTDQCDSGDELGMLACDDDHQFPSPTDASQGDRYARSLGTQSLEPLDDVPNQTAGRSGVTPLPRVGAGTATVGERGEVPRFSQGSSQPMIPARVALNAVQDHDLPASRPARRPDRDVQGVPIGGHKRPDLAAG